MTGSNRSATCSAALSSTSVENSLPRGVKAIFSRGGAPLSASASPRSVLATGCSAMPSSCFQLVGIFTLGFRQKLCVGTVVENHVFHNALITFNQYANAIKLAGHPPKEQASLTNHHKVVDGVIRNFAKAMTNKRNARRNMPLCWRKARHPVTCHKLVDL